VAQTVTEQDIRTLLQKKSPDLADQVLPTNIEQMILVIGEARDHSKQEQQDFQSNTALVEKLAENLDAEPTDEDMRQATLAIERMREVVEQAVRASTIKNRPQIEADVAKARQDIAWMEANIDLVAPIPKMPAPEFVPTDPMRALVTVAITANGAAKNAGLRNCLACGGDVALESLDVWRVQLDGIAGSYVEEDAARAEQYRSALEVYHATNAAALEARAMAEDMIRQTKLDLSVKEQALALIEGSDPVSMPSLGEGVTIERAREMVDTAQDLHGQLIRLQQQWATIRTARAASVSHDTSAKWWSKYADDLESVAWELLDKGVGIFRDRVQKYLPPDRRFSLVLHDKTSDGKSRDVCRIGLERDGNVNLVLSGAEEAMVWLAFTVAILDSMSTPPPFALLVVPSEKAWHPDDLSAVMRALSAVPYQILLLSTTPPKRVPKDWTVLDLSGFASAENGVSTDASGEASDTEIPVETPTPPPPPVPAPDKKPRKKAAVEAPPAAPAPSAAPSPSVSAPPSGPPSFEMPDDWESTTFE
jgi:hypothetical protein